MSLEKPVKSIWTNRAVPKRRWSYSTGSRFLRCPYAYSLEEIEGIIPQISPLYLTRGTLTHKGLEGALRAQHRGERGDSVLSACANAVHSMWEEWKGTPAVAAVYEGDDSFADSADELLKVSQSIALRQVRFGELHTDRWETLAIGGEPVIEYEVLTPIYTDRGVFNFSSRIDWAARDQSTGHAWAVDFKTRKAMQQVEEDETNAQHGVYLHQLRSKGLDLQGTLTWQIRAEIPKTPKLNKPTKKVPVSMSRAAIATNWETYSVALVEAGLDPLEYDDVRKKLSDFERMSYTFRTKAEAEGVWLEWVRLLAALYRDQFPHYPRAMNTYNCKGCVYKDLCLERLRGQPVDDNDLVLFGLTKKEEDHYGCEDQAR